MTGIYNQGISIRERKCQMAKCTVNINAAIPILVYFDCRVDR